MRSVMDDEGYVTFGRRTPPNIDKLLSDAGVIVGGPTKWGQSFWRRAQHCPYDGVLVQKDGWGISWTMALMIGILVHACLAEWYKAKTVDAMLRPLRIILDFAGKALAEEGEQWARDLYDWATAAWPIVAGYPSRWPDQKVAPTELPTVEDLMKYDFRNVQFIEQPFYLPPGSRFPFSFRGDLVIYARDLDGSICAVDVDHKTSWEDNSDFVRSFWQDLQLSGTFYTWERAKPAGAPPMRYAIVNTLIKPGSYRASPEYRRYLFPLRPDRLAVFEQSMIHSWEDFSRWLNAANTGPEGVPLWKLVEQRWGTCRDRKYRDCERRDVCLTLRDLSVYQPVSLQVVRDNVVAALEAHHATIEASSSAPPLVAPPPPPAAVTPPEVAAAGAPVVPSTTTSQPLPQAPGAAVGLTERVSAPAASSFMTRDQRGELQALVEKLGHNADWFHSESLDMFGHGLNELTEAEARTAIVWLRKEVGQKGGISAAPPVTAAPPPATAAEVPPAQPAPLGTGTYLAGELAALVTLANNDPTKLEGVHWLSVANRDDLLAYAATLPGNYASAVPKFGPDVSLDEIRLELAKLWRKWASDPGVPAAAPAPEPAAPATSPYADLQVPGAADKVTLGDFLAEPIHARDAVRGHCYMARRSVCWATGMVNPAGECIFLLPGSVQLAVGPDVMIVECKVELKVKDEETVVGADVPRLIGKGARVDGVCDVWWLGAWPKTQARVTDSLKDEKITPPCLGVAMIGKDPAKRSLKVFDWDGKELTTPGKKEVGTGLWDSLGRMALEALNADLGVRAL